MASPVLCGKRWLCLATLPGDSCVWAPPRLHFGHNCKSRDNNPAGFGLWVFPAVSLKLSRVSPDARTVTLSLCGLFGSRGSTGREKNDKPLPPSLSRPNTFLRGSSSKELLLDNQAQEEQRREMLETVKQLTGGMEMDRNSTEAERNKAKESGKQLLHARGIWLST